MTETRNSLLAQIVVASGGEVRNPHNRDMLLEDWLLSVQNSACSVYLFSSANSDSLEIESFTGNLKVMIAAPSEAGINPAIIAGRQGDFVASTDPVNGPTVIQYEIEASAITQIVSPTFNGVVYKYAKDNVWYDVNMGAPAEQITYYTLSNSKYTGATFADVSLQNTDIVSLNIIGITNSTSILYFLGGDTSATIWYRGSDGRLRITDDAGSSFTFFGITDINDEAQHYIEFRSFTGKVELWLNGMLRSTASGTPTTFTFNVIGARAAATSLLNIGAVFGVTLGGYASWSMVSSEYSINAEDSIGTNNLTYTDAPPTPVDTDFTEVSDA